MSGVVLPGGVQVPDKDLQPPSKELLALNQIAVNQVGLSELLKNIATLLEIQIKIQVGYQSRNGLKQRFIEAERLEREAAAGRDVDDVGTRGEGEEDYLQEYQSLQERTDADREAESGGGRATEETVGEEGVSA